MLKNEMDVLSEYYQYELSYLRSAGVEFAKKHPKIARRLDMSHNESSDPHVERIVESFAFLSGKLQKQIDDQFPGVASTLLNILYQPLILPIPSCVFVKFDIDQERAMQAIPSIVPKNTILHAQSVTGEKCTFTTAHDLEIWPLELLSTSIVQKENVKYHLSDSTYYLKIEIKYNATQDSPKPKKIRFYLHADALLKSKLFAALFATESEVLLHHHGEVRPIGQISPVGLEDNESLLPYPQSVHRGFRFIQEYFAFPEKFYGFEVHIPQEVDISGDSFVFVPITSDINSPISKDNLSLSSVPAINLFPKVTDPFKMDYKQLDYRMIADARDDNLYEIYSIDRMITIDTENYDEEVIPEFFSYEENNNKKKSGLFWTSSRKKTYLENKLGDDLYISFFDSEFNLNFTEEKLFYAHTLCSNRYEAEHIPANCNLDIEISIPATRIYCIDRPTPQVDSPKTGEFLWKLISILSLNSISFNEHGIQKIKNILETFATHMNSRLSGEIDSIISLNCNQQVKRIGNQTWQGFAIGTDVEITFDHTIVNLGLPLSLVLSKFLSSFIPINTFVEVSVKNVTKNGIVKKWNHTSEIMTNL